MHGSSAATESTQSEDTAASQAYPVRPSKDLTHTERVDIIYRIIALKQPMASISTLTGVNYSTIRTVYQ